MATHQVIYEKTRRQTVPRFSVLLIEPPTRAQNQMPAKMNAESNHIIQSVFGVDAEEAVSVDGISEEDAYDLADSIEVQEESKAPEADIAAMPDQEPSREPVVLEKIEEPVLNRKLPSLGPVDSKPFKEAEVAAPQ